MNNIYNKSTAINNIPFHIPFLRDKCALFISNRGLNKINCLSAKIQRA